MTVQNKGIEQGYNSSTGNFDTKREPQWNHEIQLSQLQVTNIGNTNYYGFVVDVNEPNGKNKALISLDSLKIWTSPTLQNSTSTDSQGHFNGSLGALAFDLGSGNTVKYNDKQHGSGSGDLKIFIPVSNFANAKSTDYVYMYQMWGNSDISEGGFEETAMLAGTAAPVIPEFNAFFPVLGLIVAAVATEARRRRRRTPVAR